MLNKPYNESIHEIDVLYKNLVNMDSTSARETANRIKRYARNHNDKSLVMEMELFWGYFLSLKYHNREKCLQQLFMVESIAAQDQLYPIQIRALGVIAKVYWDYYENYQKAFENYIRMEKALNNVTYSEYPTKVKDLFRLGGAYYDFRNYKKAIYYFQKAVIIPETDFNSLFLATSINTLGLCYQKIGDYNTSNHWLNKIAGMESRKIRILWVPIARGNIGYNYFLQKKYHKAVPLITIDLKNAEKTHDLGRAAGALIPLAEIALYNNDLSLAYKYLLKARNYINKSRQFERLRFWYPVMSKLSSAKAMPEKAFLYLDSTVAANKANNKKYNSLKIMRAQQKIDAQEQKLKIAQLNLVKQQKIVDRNRWIVLLVFFLLCSVVLYFIQRKRTLQKNHRIKTTEFSLQTTQLKLEKASMELNNFTRRVMEKNKLIEKLKQESKIVNNSSTVIKLKESTILTDEDWREFKELFEKVYPAFERKLREKYSQLTPSLVRFLMLYKLGLSNKEMASMLGVSANSLQVARHRVIKKLGLESQSPIEDLLEYL